MMARNIMPYFLATIMAGSLDFQGWQKFPKRCYRLAHGILKLRHHVMKPAVGLYKLAYILGLEVSGMIERIANFLISYFP